jgi:hypothetical protein
VYSRGWAGPVNVRALGGPPDLGGPRGADYARTVAVARALDGRRDLAAVREWAELTSELPVTDAMVATVLDVMVRAGWAVPA